MRDSTWKACTSKKISERKSCRRSVRVSRSCRSDANSFGVVRALDNSSSEICSPHAARSRRLATRLPPTPTKKLSSGGIATAAPLPGAAALASARPTHAAELHAAPVCTNCSNLCLNVCCHDIDCPSIAGPRLTLFSATLQSVNYSLQFIITWIPAFAGKTEGRAVGIHSD